MKTRIERPNFTDILGMHSDDIDRPKPLPTGTYSAVVQDIKEGIFEKSGTPVVEVVFGLTGVIDAVDEEALAAAGGLNGRTIRHTFWLDPTNRDGGHRAAWELKNFLDNCGVEPGIMGARVEAAVNAEVGIELVHVPDKRNTGNLYANYSRSVKL